jgi:DNA-binding MarR family transcriptional regulator
VQDALNFSYLLLDVGRLFLKRYASRAAAFGFTLQQSKALGYLARNEGISQARLAELCDLEPMTLARIVERMESDGWVKRNRDARDRRSNCLYMTTEGERILEKMMLISAELRAQIIAGVSLEERVVFMTVLEYLFATLLVMDDAPRSTDDP